MLKELHCDQFRNGPIHFHPGLNAVLGDAQATNSIGKSSLLMIVDFVFGGSTLTTHNRDIFAELGQLEFRFVIASKFRNHFFARDTTTPNEVQVCNSDFSAVRKISLKEYTLQLKTIYEIDDLQMTFRETVGVYSRVWGKRNDDVKKPLHASPEESSRICINRLLRLFDRYGRIAESDKALEATNAKRSSFRSAFKSNLIPSITKSRFQFNQKNIENAKKEIEKISKEIKNVTLSVNEITNTELIELRSEKDGLMKSQLQLRNRLQRIDENLSGQRRLSRRNFQSLTDFFDNVNIERLDEIESFHSGISRILKRNLEQAKEEAQKALSKISDQLSIVDSRIKELLKEVKVPKAIVNRVLDLGGRIRSAEEENKTYLQFQKLNAQSKDLKKEVSNLTARALSGIEFQINSEIESITLRTFDGAKKSPKLTLEESRYRFEIYEDTGTGAQFTNLIEFDLAIFGLSRLPYVIHDSMLFKNIENEAVSKLLQAYSEHSRQSFLALDEIDKYGRATSTFLRNQAVCQLSDQNVLFNKDWR